MDDKEEEDPFVYDLTNTVVSQPTKRKRGRPAKTKTETKAGASQVQQYHSKVMENIFNVRETKPETKPEPETKTQTEPVNIEQPPQPTQEDPRPVEKKKQRLTPLQYIEHLPYLPDDIKSRDIFEMAIDLQKLLVDMSEEQVGPLYDAVEHLIEHEKYKSNDKGGHHYPVMEDRRLSLSSLDLCKKPLKDVVVKRLIYLRLLEMKDEDQREVGFAAFVDHCTFF